jgi:hypothetical protein
LSRIEHQERMPQLNLLASTWILMTKLNDNEMFSLLLSNLKSVYLMSGESREVNGSHWGRLYRQQVQ